MRRLLTKFFLILTPILFFLSNIYAQSKNEFNVRASYKRESSEFIFGRLNGFNVFHSDSIKDNPEIPVVTLTVFKIFSREIKFDRRLSEIEEIVLSYKDRFFSFEFTALDITNPQKNQYAYKMEGFDTEWIYCGQRRFASYTHLDPGDYVFKIKSSNNDGIWNDEDVSVKIKIIPPFWQTWWFRLIAGFSLIMLLFISRVTKLRKVKREQIEFTKKLIEVQEQERKRIASELHDSLGQDLLIINSGIQQCSNSLPKQKEVTNDLSKLSEMVLQSINEVREISYNLHPHQLDRLGLKKAIESIIKKLSQSSKTNFIFDIDDIDGLFPKNIEINIFRAIQEGLNNVIKHSEAFESRIKVNKGKKYLHILIQDNGKGFQSELFNSANVQNHNFGLYGIAERVKIFKGKIFIDTKPGQGTRLQIDIPITSIDKAK